MLSNSTKYKSSNSLKHCDTLATAPGFANDQDVSSRGNKNRIAWGLLRSATIAALGNTRHIITLPVLHCQASGTKGGRTIRKKSSLLEPSNVSHSSMLSFHWVLSIFGGIKISASKRKEGCDRLIVTCWWELSQYLFPK